MKKLLLVILLIPLGCINAPLKSGISSGDIDRLTAFMNMCERDIRNTRQVILDRDIVKNLSHLQFMNAGGKKFYLLERESITSMLRAVTEGIYSDYILVNSKGTVIYTMNNNDLFSKNVKTQLRHSPLNESFRHRSEVYHFQAARFSGITGSSHLFISCVAEGGDTFPGIIILQVNMSKILELLGRDTRILDSSGRYMISQESGFTEMTGEKAAQAGIYSNSNGIKGAGPGKGRPFTHRNLEWILIQR